MSNPVLEDREKIKKSSTEDLLDTLDAVEGGLTSKEAQIRLEDYGLNEIVEKKENNIVKFLKYFWGPIPWMIEIAIIISAFLVVMRI